MDAEIFESTSWTFPACDKDSRFQGDSLTKCVIICCCKMYQTECMHIFKNLENLEKTLYSKCVEKFMKFGKKTAK